MEYIPMSGFTFNNHSIEQMMERKISPQLIDKFILLNYEQARKFNGSNGTTKLVLNNTRIKSMIDMIDLMLPKHNNCENEYATMLMENKAQLKKLLKEGGITAVINEDKKIVVTVY